MMLARGPRLIDVLEIEDGSIVLVDDQLLRLSDVATEALFFVSEPKSLAVLTGHLVSVFGIPDGVDPELLVSSLCDELCRLGVLAKDAA